MRFGIKLARASTRREFVERISGEAGRPRKSRARTASNHDVHGGGPVDQEMYDRKITSSHQIRTRGVMATNSTMPIWTPTIAPDAEDDAVGDHRDDAYEAVVLVVLVLRKSVEIMKALKIRDSEQEGNVDTPDTMRISPDKVAPSLSRYTNKPHFGVLVVLLLGPNSVEITKALEIRDAGQERKFRYARHDTNIPR